MPLEGRLPKKKCDSQSAFSLDLQPKGRKPLAGNRGRNGYNFVVLLLFFSLTPIISCAEKTKFTVLT